MKTERDRDILQRHYLGDEDKGLICEALELTSAHFDRVLCRARQCLKSTALAVLN